MVSKQVVNILGLQLHVFGLEEYKKLPENTPLAGLFFCTGVKTPQEYVEESCHQMCTLNDNRNANDRYLIVISLDHPNVGSRDLYRDDVVQMTKTLNGELLSKMYLHAKSTAHSISLIIECFDMYVFGENRKSYVEKWGVAGFSMGGVSAALAVAMEPKIEVVIMISSTLNYLKWAEHLANHLGFPDDFYHRVREAEVVTMGTQNYISNLSNTKLLILHGDRDGCVSIPTEKKYIDELRELHHGKEGYEWKHMILKVKGHGVNRAYNAEAMEWTKKWMTSNVQFAQAKL